MVWSGTQLSQIDSKQPRNHSNGQARDLGGSGMATFEKKPKPAEPVPVDLLPIIRGSGVLSDRQFADIKGKVLNGDYPNDSVALADRLVKEKILTEYQTRRFLSNKSHGLVVGRYV